MKLIKDFAGLDGFYWWFGVVENRQDPKKIGRCQVRIFGAHTGSTSDIPSADLPWAHPVHSINNQMFSTPKEGDMVFGFFLDGNFAQQPVIIGVVPSVATDLPEGTTGFNDIRTVEELQLAPKKPRGISYGNNDGTGAKIMEQQDGFELVRTPYDTINHATNSDLARNERIKSSFIQTRRESLVEVRGAFGTSWKEPFPAYAAKYPYNRVLETESGHIQEFDDTPGAERIHTAHRSGTFEEIYPSGTKVEKIVKNNYKIVLADDHMYVSGKVNITVGSHANIKVEGDVNLEGRGELTASFAGNMNFCSGGDFKLKAKSVVVETQFDYNVKAAGAIKLGSDGGLHLTTEKLKISSDNGLTLLTNGELVLSAAEILLQAGIGVNIAAPLFNSAAPISSFLHVNATTTNLMAIGSDSHGDFHALPVGPGISLPEIPVLAATPLPTNYIIYPPRSTFLGDAPTYGDPTLSPRFRDPTPVDTAAFGMGGSTDDQKSIDAFISRQIENGIYTQEQIDEGYLITKKPVTSDPDYKTNKSYLIQVNNYCNIGEDTEINSSTALSKYFTLGDLTVKPEYSKYPLKAQRGALKSVIACNLKTLAVNCLDKIKKQYPTMKIVNGFRHIDEFSDQQSPHEIGQAADIQFDALSNNPMGYYDVALWIKDNIPYDQLMLEYRTTGNRSPWIHISYNNLGNRPVSSPNKIVTTMNHKTIATKLVKLDTTVKKILPVAISKTSSVDFNGNSVITETKPTYEKKTGKLINVKTVITVDRKTKNITEEVTLNDGDSETITTTIKTPAGGVIGTPRISYNKFESDDPRDGPGGLIAKLMASLSFSLNIPSGILAGLFRDATDPILRQLEGKANDLGNLANQLETFVGNIRDVSCEIYSQYSKLSGKIKREVRTIKDAWHEVEKATEKATNLTFKIGGVVQFIVKKAVDALKKKLEELEQALLAQLDAMICKIIMFWPNELKALAEEMDATYARLHGVYDRLVVQRIQKYKQLRDDIKTHSITWCDDAGVASSGNANSDTNKTRKGCQD